VIVDGQVVNAEKFSVARYENDVYPANVPVLRFELCARETAIYSVSNRDGAVEFGHFI